MSGSRTAYTLPLDYKRESVHGSTQVLQVLPTSDSQLPRTLKPFAGSFIHKQAIQYSVYVGYYAPAARTTQNPCVFFMFQSF